VKQVAEARFFERCSARTLRVATFHRTFADLPPDLVTHLSKNLAKHLSKNLVTHLSKNLVTQLYIK
jgi:hypothetical protein